MLAVASVSTAQIAKGAVLTGFANISTGINTEGLAGGCSTVIERPLGAGCDALPIALLIPPQMILARRPRHFARNFPRGTQHQEDNTSPQGGKHHRLLLHCSSNCREDRRCHLDAVR